MEELVYERTVTIMSTISLRDRPAGKGEVEFDPKELEELLRLPMPDSRYSRTVTYNEFGQPQTIVIAQPWRHDFTQIETITFELKETR
jgi:hypothetical protein